MMEEYFLITKEEMLKIRTKMKPNPLGKGHGSQWLSMAYYEVDAVMETVLAHPLSEELKKERERVLKAISSNAMDCAKSEGVYSGGCRMISINGLDRILESLRSEP